MTRHLPVLISVPLLACLLFSSCSLEGPSDAVAPPPAAPAGKDAAANVLPPEFLEAVLQAFAVQPWEELVFTLAPPHYRQVLSPATWSIPYEISVVIPRGQTSDLDGAVVTVKVRVPALGSIPEGSLRLADCTLFEIEGTPPEGASFAVGLSPAPWNFQAGPTYVHQLVGDGQGYQFTEPVRQNVGPLPWRQPQVSLIIGEGRDLITRALTEPIKR
jgi:hypothetical protein